MHIVTDEFLNHLKVRTTNPGALHAAYQGVLDLPPPLYACVTAEQATETLAKIDGEFLATTSLLGRTGWPVSAREVARRIVGKFSGRTSWELYLYMNGGKQEPRAESRDVHFDVRFDAREGDWFASVDPTSRRLIHNEGCKPFEARAETIEKVLALIENVLAAASLATKSDVEARFQRDRKKSAKKRVPETAPKQN